MQTEEMKRLLKDGKIVGWEKKELIDGLVRTLYRSSKKDAIYFWVESPITQYNSFELGIKVGDDWLFEGDLFMDNEDGFNYAKYELVCGYIDWHFEHEVSDSKSYKIQSDGSYLYDTFIETIDFNDIYGCLKRIGNIHEENK